jgi:hypothetical protein
MWVNHFELLSSKSDPCDEILKYETIADLFRDKNIAEICGNSVKVQIGKN